MNKCIKLNTNRNSQKKSIKLIQHARATTASHEEMDERLHEALMMSFDCGDPVALQIA